MNKPYSNSRALQVLPMSNITAKVPDSLLKALDATAAELEISRSALVRQALQRYLDDYGDLAVAIERLQDPSDRTMRWHEVRNALLNTS